MSEQFPGVLANRVLTLFTRGESFDSSGFADLFVDVPIYQFGNFGIETTRAGIEKSAANFFSQISAVYHEIKMLWEAGSTVFVEMNVSYWRKDNSLITLPCADIFRFEGEQFAELRIFMDVNPVFDASLPVAENASVFTMSGGKQNIPPGTMRKFTAETPAIIERVKNGFVPKWSIEGPKWEIKA